jgi:glutamate synthase (NADPH/NADH) small chain
LSAAYFLARKGYRPTVFEATDHPGGLLYWAIPRFRLPEAALQRDLDYIKSWGVEIKTNTALGKDFTIEDLQQSRCVLNFSMRRYIIPKRRWARRWP